MKPQFYKKILKNGMTIILEKRELPIISVAFAVRHGGIHETLEEKGISHYIEHMLYKGTPTRNAKKIAEEIEKNGGVLSGFTSDLLTAYWCKMPSRHLNIALDVLSDMVKNPLFDKTELEKERKVIFEELKMNHDNPTRHVFNEIQKMLYSGTFSIDLIGTYETMNAIDKNIISKKFNEVYVPNNMVLCVVGDADFDKLCNFVEKTFGDKKSKITKKELGLKNESHFEKRKGIDQANLILAYHVPVLTDDKSFAAEVLSAVMAEGMSSRLFTEIREKEIWLIRLGGTDINRDYAYNFIYVGTTKENVEKVKELILEEFDKVVKTLDEKELNSVKEQLMGNYQLAMEDSQSQMVNLLSHEINGKAEDFYEYEKKIKAVKLEDVKKIASNVKKGYSFFALVPED